MKSLLQKTIYIFLRHPILWLPFLCEAALSEGRYWLQRAIRRGILAWFAAGYTGQDRSVLEGGAASGASTLTPAHALQFDCLVNCGLNFVTECIGAVTLVATALLVVMVLRGESPNGGNLITQLRGNAKRILAYSAKIWVLSMLLQALGGLWSGFQMVRVPTRTAPMEFLAREIPLLLSVIVSGVIVAPMAVRLLRPVDAPPLTATAKKTGCFVLIGAAVASHVLGSSLQYLIRLVTAQMRLASGFAAIAVSHVLRPVWTMPYLLGMIALSLLAMDGKELVDRSGLQIDPREVLRKLMPLHYGQGDRM